MNYCHLKDPQDYKDVPIPREASLREMVIVIQRKDVSICLDQWVLFFIIFVRANRVDGITASPAGSSAWWVG